MEHFRGPADRHYLRKVTQRTLARERNTVIVPGVDVTADVAAINEGLGQTASGGYLINGRTYGIHGQSLYPISGPGFIQLDRPAFQALGVYNKFGNTEQAARIIDAMAQTNPGLTPDQRLAALQSWQIGQGVIP